MGTVKSQVEVANAHRALMHQPVRDLAVHFGHGQSSGDLAKGDFIHNNRLPLTGAKTF
ncbi:MAG: hypothetical protein AB9873_18935 [Syntrophobacteraceae bacterium]